MVHKFFFALATIALCCVAMLVPTGAFLYLVVKHLKGKDSLVLALLVFVALSLISFIVNCALQMPCHIGGSSFCIYDNNLIYSIAEFVPPFFENSASVINTAIWINFYLGSSALLARRFDIVPIEAKTIANHSGSPRDFMLPASLH